MRTGKLTGAALDWAVAKCQGIKLYPSKNKRWMTANYGEFNPRHGAPWWRPSSSWEQGGPLIEREGIEICRLKFVGEWRGQLYEQGIDKMHREYGPTPLIAAMRCFVVSKLGDEVNVPDDLNKEPA